MFAQVTKTKKERIKKYTSQVKASSDSKSEQRKTLAAYKKKLAASHTAYKKQFPVAGKLTDTATVRALIAKLSKQSF